MKKLVVVITAIGLSMAASFLIVSPRAVSTMSDIVLRAAPNEQRTPPMGTYLNVDAGFGSAEITFFADGHYTYGDQGSVSAEGTYKVTGNQILFMEYGPADADCLQLPGKYTWVFARNVLTLTEVEDRCPTRQYDWGSGEWIRPR